MPLCGRALISVERGTLIFLSQALSLSWAAAVVVSSFRLALSLDEDKHVRARFLFCKICQLNYLLKAWDKQSRLRSSLLGWRVARVTLFRSKLVCGRHIEAELSP